MNDRSGQRPSEATAVESTAATSTFRQRKPIIQWREFGRWTAALFRQRKDLKAIWFGNDRIEPAFREELMLAVAGANSCRQCSYAHREWALAEGLLEAELVALEGLDAESFDAKTWAAVAWVQEAARSDFTAVPEAIDANFKALYGFQEQADIELVARTMAWMNRVSNTVDAAVERLRRRPVPGSGVGREVLAVVVYALVVPAPAHRAGRQAEAPSHDPVPRHRAVLPRVRVPGSSHDFGDRSERPGIKLVGSASTRRAEGACGTRGRRFLTGSRRLVPSVRSRFAHRGLAPGRRR